MSLRFTAPIARSIAGRRSAQSLQVRNQVVRRRFATGGGPEIHPPPPPRASNVPYMLAGVGIAAAGAAYLFFGTDGTAQDTAKEIGTTAKEAVQIVEQKAGLTHSKADYQKVYDAIAESLEVEGYDDGSVAPVLVRLAWHCSGTYDKEDNTGGSNYATMRFKPEASHGANNGLNYARDHMQKIKEKFPWISYGDLWTLGGVVAVQESGGPTIPWRAGRIDGFEHHVTPDGRLPDAAQAQDHLRFIFYRMGMDDKEIVALSGAHALGRCHTDRSGFEGPWSFSPTTFSNAYFDLLLNEPWAWRKWKGPAQYEDKKTKSLMMLPTDMALIKDKSFRKHAEKYAKDEGEFFKDFSAAYAKLLELGVPKAQLPSQPWSMGAEAK